MGIEGGLYDTGDAYLGMIEGGVGYESGPLVHYLFAGAGRINRDDEGSESASPDLDEFEFGYRLAYPITEKSAIFAEFGAESFRGEAHTADALGNPVNLCFDSDHCFLGAGFRMTLWKGLYVDLSCRYLLGIDVSSFSNTNFDALGNPVQTGGDTSSFLVKFGVGYWF